MDKYSAGCSLECKPRGVACKLRPVEVYPAATEVLHIVVHPVGRMQLVVEEEDIVHSVPKSKRSISMMS